jgi:hypothetical protein
MSFSLIPKYAFRHVTDITIDFLRRQSVKFLMLDLDNTIARYDESLPSGEISRWAEELQNGGVTLFIVSNSILKGRVEAFAEAMGIGYIKGANKPSVKGIFRAMETAGFIAAESALAGDQIFTDTLAANSAGALSLIVRPRSRQNPLLALRYGIELPFRAFCKNKLYGVSQ